MIDLFLVLVDRYCFIQYFFSTNFCEQERVCLRLSNVRSLVTRHYIEHVGTRPRTMFVYSSFKMEGDSSVRGCRDPQKDLRANCRR